MKTRPLSRAPVNPLPVAGGAAPAAAPVAGTPAAVVAHETSDFRPLTAPEIRPQERVLKQFPNPQFAAKKLAEVAAAATGDAKVVLEKAAKAADRILNSVSLNLGPNERPQRAVEGRLVREVRVVNGEHSVRATVRPEAGGRPVVVPLEAVAGIPNGASVTLEPSGRLDLSRSRPLANMVGVVEKRGDAFVVRGNSAMSPLSSLTLEDGNDALLGKLVLVDVRAKGQERVGVVHDVLEPKSELQRIELVTAAESGIALTFPPEVLAQVQKLRESPPQFELKPGMRDLRELPIIATDNPGSRSDYRSIDPEQASNVSFSNGRMVLTDFLANRKLLIEEGSPIDQHAMQVMQTFYGSGFDAPALPGELSEDLAVFLQDKPRYATAVKAVFDVEVTPNTDADPSVLEKLSPLEKQVLAQSQAGRTMRDLGQSLNDVPGVEAAVQSLAASGAALVKANLVLDESEVFDALVVNRWAGSYREADRLYASEDGDTSFTDAGKALPAGVKEQLDAFRFAGEALQAMAIDRGQLNAGGNDGRYVSERVREQFSTTINEVLPLVAKEAGVDLIQRYHPEAKAEKVERFRSFVSAFGMAWPPNESFETYLEKIPERVAEVFADRTPLERDVINEIVRVQGYRTLEKAIYSVDGGGHAGLAKAMYAHGSASNRQNTGKANLNNAVYASEVMRGTATGEVPHPRPQLEAWAEHATDVELLYSRVVERQVANVRQAMTLKPIEGQTVKALVGQMTPGGLELKLLEPRAQVFVPLARVGEVMGNQRFELSDEGVRLVGNRGSVFSVGDAIDVNIVSVDTDLGSVDAVPVLDPDAKLEPAPQEQYDRQGRQGRGQRDNNRRGRNR